MTNAQPVRVAAVAENFGRDLDESYRTIARLLAAAREEGVALVALPEAALGGYLSSLGGGRDVAETLKSRPNSLPPALRLDGPEIARVIAMAGDVIVVFGFCEAEGELRYNTAVALDGTGILGVHRKVHQPLGENLSYAPGESFEAFDTPIGRMGMLICYDKAFPEAARSLALDGAEIVVCISAWPASQTASSDDLSEDRWTKRFNLFDQARALENQVVWVASNQSGTFGSLRFVCNAKVVGPGGDVLATTGTASGMAVATVDVAELLGTARRSMFHLRDRRPAAYLTAEPAVAPAAPDPDRAAIQAPQAVAHVAEPEVTHA
ncbi:carbon-nitrogen hydrolase family protein [Subtercola boreus]|uniref:Carbon-nitrogen hydrolase family protein n=1 Tax=Subtercola boreus TaxID=120213 RepID=A0A3E0WAM6_9MICO|nr:carbon-nitrogen hydrolase family protein [Subtercola boreus]RFA21056.1 carbon-nitrogen hydrolase family protein [Subtercola boreus]RFA21440.1 carbon-nitrogen hydrolase family protein [Subtercola boreus]RFA27411.1 carbon-nitrogen hydrolase family protein [Subtercola boreus]